MYRMSHFFTISCRFCYCSPYGGCHGRSPPRGTPETAIRSVVPQMVGQFNYLSKHRDVSAIREALNLNTAAERQRQMQRGKKKAFVGKSAATIQLMLTQWQLKTVMTKTVYVFWIFHSILSIFQFLIRTALFWNLSEQLNIIVSSLKTIMKPTSS